MKPPVLAPAYCSLYPSLCEVARNHGYSLAIHGTLARDMDLIAVAWTDEAVEPLELVKAVAEKIDGQMGMCARSNGDGSFAEVSSWEPSVKPHGRLAWSIRLRDLAWDGTNPFIDLSVIPPKSALANPSNGCPCVLADEPCQPGCSCRNEHQSAGCLCCARYGSDEQRKLQSNRILKDVIGRS